MKITPIAMGGTSESYPGDTRTEMPAEAMLTSVTKCLDAAHFNPARWVGYPAMYAGDLSYEESMGYGIEALANVIAEENAAGNLIMLLGYSQSAVIMRRMLAMCKNGEMGDPDYLAAMIVGCALVADPVRPVGMAVGHDPGGYGLAGTEPYWDAVPLWEAAADRDPICAAPYNSFLRTAADFTGFFGFTAKALNRWMTDAGQKIRNKEWQNANLDWGQFWLIGMRVNQAIDQLGGYLPQSPLNPGGGRHTCYNKELVPGSPFTFCELLAVQMNTRARKLLT